MQEAEKKIGKLMKQSFNKNIYSRNALLKAAYHFTDDYFIHLDASEDNYIVEAESKSKDSLVSDFEGKFANELLAQTTREVILSETSDIRKLVLARAIASTIVEDNEEEEIITAQQEFGNELFEDWYVSNN